MNKNCVPIANPKIIPSRLKRQRQKKMGKSVRPNLRFTPTAWAKLLFLRDYGETEVGGFGITAHDDLLLIEDIRLVKQACTWAYVAFEDIAVADFFDEQVDAGRRPEQFARIWIHTHPGDCPQPSAMDEETFARVFCRSEWAIMFILAQGGQAFARLRYNVGPGTSLNLPVSIDYTRPFDGCDFADWEQEYLVNVQRLSPIREVLQSRERFVPATSDQYPIDPWSELWMDGALNQDSPGAIIL
jgi:hypothetical protein